MTGKSCGKAKRRPTDLYLAFDRLVGVHLKGVAGEVDLAVEHHKLLLQAFFLLIIHTTERQKKKGEEELMCANMCEKLIVQPYRVYWVCDVT